MVAALQANGQLVNQSNHGPAHVEIGAPGCDVPTLIYEETVGAFRTQNVSGTSFAAPLVSFAAALVRGEYGADIAPHEIKNRVLVSADLNPALADRIKDGRVLNIAKAISIFHDVVQDVEGNIYRGELRWYVDNVLYEPGQDRTVLFDCDREPRGLSPDDILKLWFDYPRADGSPGVMVYSQDKNSKQFQADVCSIPDSGTLRFDLVDSLSGAVRGPPLSDVRDVITKIR